MTQKSNVIFGIKDKKMQENYIQKVIKKQIHDKLENHKFINSNNFQISNI